MSIAEDSPHVARKIPTAIEHLKVLRLALAPGWSTSPEGREQLSKIDTVISEELNDVSKETLNKRIVLGALIDFVGYLTTRPQTFDVGGEVTVYALHDHLTAWCAARGLSVSEVKDPATMDWTLRLASNFDEWEASNIAMLETPLQGSNGLAWAQFFVRVFPRLKAKEDLMMGWFANAQMSYYDHFRNTKLEPALDLVQRAYTLLLDETEMGGWDHQTRNELSAACIGALIDNGRLAEPETPKTAQLEPPYQVNPLRG